MLGLEVADARDRCGIADFQLVEDQVLFGVMKAIGIVLEITDDRLNDLVIRPLAVVEDVELTFQDGQQHFDISMLVTEHLDKLRHRAAPPTGMSGIRKSNDIKRNDIPKYMPEVAAGFCARSKLESPEVVIPVANSRYGGFRSGQNQ